MNYTNVFNLMVNSIFQGSKDLNDTSKKEVFFRSLNVDPSSSDDTEFNVSEVYCSAHMRVHKTGWCSTKNVNKFPVDETMLEDYRKFAVSV